MSGSSSSGASPPALDEVVVIAQRLNEARNDTGRIARSACLAAATENTHGFEIAHLDAIEGCVRILQRWLG